MIKVSPNLKVTYKYDLQMKPAVTNIKQLLQKWSDQYFNRIYDGRMLLLISPIFIHEQYVYVMPTLDVDLGFTGSFAYLQKFFKRSAKRRKFWFAEYTGKNGFHIYAKFLVRLDPSVSNNISMIRSIIFKPFKNELQGIDTVSSIRNVPTIRIGYRHDTGRMAIPLLKNNIRWVVKHSRHRGFDGVFDRQGLYDYIQKYLIPRYYITMQQYLLYVR